MSAFSLHPFVPFKLSVPNRVTASKKFPKKSACFDDSQTSKKPQQQQQQQLNLSVLRFTLGIPGLDESYLPRWIGYGFGSLLILNHFLGSNFADASAAQLRSEALGLSLAAFSIGLPYIGKFLKGATPVDKVGVQEGTEQIFSMAQDISDTQKENLAWASYVLLRNTNATAVLISAQDELCVRGYWNTPENVHKSNILDWFVGQIEKLGLADLEDTLYFPQGAKLELQELLPGGTRSLLVQPVPISASGSEKNRGFLMLVSTMEYAYTDKDISWIRAVANKFKGKS